MKWLAKKRKKQTSKQEQLKELRKSRRFRGVQLHRCGCRASTRYIGKFFSFGNAPALPLADCDAEVCSCAYLGVVDRRRNDRRGEESPIELSLLSDERRMVRNRRRLHDIWKGRSR